MGLLFWLRLPSVTAIYAMVPFLSNLMWIVIGIIILSLMIAVFLLLRITHRAQTVVHQQIQKLERCNRRYQILFQECSDAILIHTHQRIIDANTKAIELLGYTRSELLNLSVEDLLPSEDQIKDHTVDTLHTLTLRSNDQDGCYPARLKCQNGKIIDALVSSQVIDEKNDIIQLLIKDITQERNLEKTHQKSEERLNIILQAITEGIIVTNAQGIIEQANHAASILLNIPPNKMLGEELVKVVHLFSEEHSSTNSIEKIMRIVLIEGMVFRSNFHYYLPQPENKSKIVQVAAAPMRSRSGRILGMVLILHDLTEQLKLQEELLHAQKLESIGKITGQIAHDFKNWLTIILGITENLLLTVNDEKILKEIKRIHTASQSSADLVRRILTFARREPIQRHPLNIHEAIDNSIVMIDRGEYGTVEIIRKYHASHPWVQGDHSALVNAFLNLGINALEAMKTGGILSIETSNIELDREFCHRQKEKIEPGTYIHIAVTDTGTGIDPKILSNLFEPFFSTKEGQTNAGLGLASVYGTIRAHNGFITVDSKVNKGTTFHLYLPICAPPSLSSPSLADHSQEKVSHPHNSHILVIDDEPLLRELFAEMLTTLGQSVYLAESIDQASKIAQKYAHFIDLVIMDAYIPHTTPQELVTKLRAILPNSKIFLTTGVAKDRAEQLLKELQLDGYIEKPFTIDKLRSILPLSPHIKPT